MIRAFFLIVAALLVAPATSGQARPELSNLLSTSPEPPASPPTLGEIFADLGTLLRSADRTQMATLKVRLAEVEDEIRLLQNLERTLERGILVELPHALREKTEVYPTEELERTERATLARLEGQLALAEIDSRRRASASLIPEPASSGGASSLARAALEVDLEIPIPPKSAVGARAATAKALDPEGLAKALYLAKDYAGALNALEGLPESERSLESSYFHARCLDVLGRWSEARTGYEALALRDPSGHWGEHARWMLNLGAHKQNVRILLDGNSRRKEGKQ